MWPKLEHFNWALDWFDHIAHANHDTALRVVRPDGDQTVSFAALRADSARLAGWLRTIGVSRGDRVLVLLDNQVEFWELQLALMKLRAVVVPVFTTLSPAGLAERAERAGIRHVVADAEIATRLKLPIEPQVKVAVGADVPGWLNYADAAGSDVEFIPEGPTGADEPLFYFFTSGTTSRPKLVVHTQVSYAVGHLSSMYFNGLRPGDVHVNVSAPGWAKHPWSSLFAPWNAEATVVTLDTRYGTADRILDTLARVEATSFCAPPSVWRTLIRAGVDKHRIQLREATSVGEPLTEDIVATIRTAWGVTVRNGYGQSEVTAMAGVTPAADTDPTSMGFALPGYRLVVRAPGGAVEDDDLDEGELCVDLVDRPLGMMRGYLDEAGPATSVGSGRLYRTGDLVRRESDGSLRFLGRLKDILYGTGGALISPVELERRLSMHPAVDEVAVVPVTAEAAAPVAKAYVLLAVGWNGSAATAKGIFRHVEVTCPRQLALIEFIDSFPRTESGKIHRELLRSYPRSVQTEFRAADPSDEN
ncbi:AMP-binding protein [Micromonospora sp. NPDC048999]|uniref:AMP-binding protein n=1 Tax=Micromonospora sp. NPDC048999 TaxID=3155391 RepID=UPI0033EB4DF1